MPSGEWIQLQLENVAVVSKVVITESASSHINKTSKRDEYRLRNVQVRVGNTQTTKASPGLIDQNDLCDTYIGPGKREEEIALACKPSVLVGQFITVQKLEQSILNVAEIEVIGKEIAFNGTKKGC